MAGQSFIKILPENIGDWIQEVPELSQINTEHLHCIFIFTDQAFHAHAALYLPSVKYKDYKKTAFFGHYKCPDDILLSKLLFKEIEAEANANDVDFIIGPVNGSTWENYRWNAEDKNPAFFTEEHHPRWYHTQAKTAGYAEIATYSSHIQELRETETEIEIETETETETETFGNILTIRNIRLNDLENELNLIVELSLSGFQRNFLYTPIKREHFVSKYLQLKKWMREEYILVAEDEDKKLCALFFALPDYLNPQKDTLVIKTIVRLPDRKYAGVIHRMQAILQKRSLENGITKWIHAFMYDQNVSRTLSKKFNGVLYRKYLLYGKEIVDCRS